MKNDIYFHLHLYTLLYANDTTYMAESEQGPTKLFLMQFFSFCKLWYLELYVIIFSRGKIRKHIKFVF